MATTGPQIIDQLLVDQRVCLLGRKSGKERRQPREARHTSRMGF
jgi:hypothetical protein